jgi:diguanylate cyclase (GGDEF)-like protein
MLSAHFADDRQKPVGYLRQEAGMTMALDISTLIIVSTCVAALLGLFFFYAWVQERDMHALAWWGGAYLLGGGGVALWIVDGVTPGPMLSGLPHAVLFLACGMIWNGARLFHGRHVLPIGLFAGALAWLVAGQFPEFTESVLMRVVLSSTIVAAYTFFSARELWHERRRKTDSRWAALFVPVLHGMVFLSPIPLVILDDGTRAPSLTSGGWGAIFVLQTLLYAVGAAFIAMMMVKDREAGIHKTAANTDPLTGVLNRRGFHSEVDALVRRSKRGDHLSLLMCDIDHFKSINDRFGHDAGDDTLRTFASVLQASLRATDVIGRLGGEEFAVILPGPLDVAATAGERVRAALEANGAGISGQSVTVTVSIGAAVTLAADLDLRALMMRADRALYQAKTGGRNRVILDLGEEASAAPVPVVPVPAPVQDFGPGLQTFAAVTTST